MTSSSSNGPSFGGNEWVVTFPVGVFVVVAVVSCLCARYRRRNAEIAVSPAESNVATGPVDFSITTTHAQIESRANPAQPIGGDLQPGIIIQVQPWSRLHVEYANTPRGLYEPPSAFGAGTAPEGEPDPPYGHGGAYVYEENDGNVHPNIVGEEKNEHFG